MTNINEKANLQTREITSEVLAKLKKNAEYSIENLRRYNGNKAFESAVFSYKSKKDTMGNDVYVNWDKDFNPCVKNITITKAATNKEESLGGEIFLFDTQWKHRLQNNGCTELYIDNKGNPPQEELKAEFDLRIKEMLKKIKKNNKGIVQTGSYIFNFEDSFFLGGAPNDKKVFLVRCPDTFRVICDYLNIGITNNTMTHEIECYHIDKKNNNKYQVSYSDMVDILFSTTEFGRGYRAVKGDFEASIEAMAGCNRYHPVKDIHSTLKQVYGDTNSTSIIDEYINCLDFDCDDDEDVLAYYKRIVKKFFVSGYAALDLSEFNSYLIPIFFGKQGIGKSSYLRSVFDITDGAWIDIDDFDICLKEHRILMNNAHAVELPEAARNLNDEKRIAAMKSVTKSKIIYQKKYKNEITRIFRQTIWYFTFNTVNFREAENRRFPLVKIKGIDHERANNILGLKHINSGIFAVIDPSKRLKLWNQIRCLYKRGYSWDLSKEDRAIAHRIAIKTETDGYVEETLKYHFGIDGNWNLDSFNEGIKNNDIKKRGHDGSGYDGINVKTIIDKLAAFDNPTNPNPLRYQKLSKKIRLFMVKRFGESGSVKCKELGNETIWGWVAPTFKSKEELKNIKKGRWDNNTASTDAWNKTTLSDNGQNANAEYLNYQQMDNMTKEESDRMVDDACI